MTSEKVLNLRNNCVTSLAHISNYITQSHVFLILYGAILITLTWYSYALVDPNLTLVNSPLWTTFRNFMVQIGYYNRQLSWNIYVSIVILLFWAHYISLKKTFKIHPVTLSIFIGLLLLLANPFLSRDLFNYMFDAKILTTYGDNPYLQRALDYPNDPWLRFMHWTHRTYPYGPTFLALTLVPSVLGFGKLLITFILFKLSWLALYILGVFSLSKIKREYGMFFATHPLVLIEGLVNVHNDLWAVSIALFAIYLLFTHKITTIKTKVYALLLFLISGGIKFFTLPLVLMQNPSSHSYARKVNILAFSIMFGLLIYASMTAQIQQWYFLNVFLLIPFCYKNKFFTYLTSFALLVSYYPLIANGSWGNGGADLMKWIILGGLTADLGLLIMTQKFNHDN